MNLAFSSTFSGSLSRLSCSQASQKAIFSSLYSLTKNSLKSALPAVLLISLSKDVLQDLISSRLTLLKSHSRPFSAAPESPGPDSWSPAPCNALELAEPGPAAPGRECRPAELPVPTAKLKFSPSKKSVIKNFDTKTPKQPIFHILTEHSDEKIKIKILILSKHWVHTRKNIECWCARSGRRQLTERKKGDNKRARVLRKKILQYLTLLLVYSAWCLLCTRGWCEIYKWTESSRERGSRDTTCFISRSKTLYFREFRR